MKEGDRFSFKDTLYEVKSLEGRTIRASKIDPLTGRPQRGKPSKFDVGEVGQTIPLGQTDRPAQSLNREDGPFTHPTEESKPKGKVWTPEEAAAFFKMVGLDGRESLI